MNLEEHWSQGRGSSIGGGEQEWQTEHCMHTKVSQHNLTNQTFSQPLISLNDRASNWLRPPRTLLYCIFCVAFDFTLLHCIVLTLYCFIASYYLCIASLHCIYLALLHFCLTFHVLCFIANQPFILFQFEPLSLFGMF